MLDSISELVILSIYISSIYIFTMTRHATSSKPQAVKSQMFLELIASKWIICVIYELGHQTKRYHEIYKAISITQKSLSVTLRKMERDGVVSRIIYPVVPPHVEYELTPLGKELLSMLDAMGVWLDVHFEEVSRCQLAYDKSKEKPPFWMQPRDPNAPLGA